MLAHYGRHATPSSINKPSASIDTSCRYRVLGTGTGPGYVTLVGASPIDPARALAGGIIMPAIAC